MRKLLVEKHDILQIDRQKGMATLESTVRDAQYCRYLDSWTSKGIDVHRNIVGRGTWYSIYRHMDIGMTPNKQWHGGTQDKCPQRYMRTLQQGYTWNSVQIEIDGKLQVEVHGKGVGRGTWEKGMQRYMGKLQVEVHGEIIGRGTWEKDMQRYMGKLQVEVHGKIIGRGTWENYRQRYMGKGYVEVHGRMLWNSYMGKTYSLSLEKCNDEMTSHSNSKLKA